MERFDHLQNQVDNLEARVRSYEVGGSAVSAWTSADELRDPAIESELERMKQRLAGKPAGEKQEEAAEA
jgi:phage shock protein A